MCGSKRHSPSDGIATQNLLVNKKLADTGVKFRCHFSAAIGDQRIIDLRGHRLRLLQYSKRSFVTYDFHESVGDAMRKGTAST